MSSKIKEIFSGPTFAQLDPEYRATVLTFTFAFSAVGIAIMYLAARIILLSSDLSWTSDLLSEPNGLLSLSLIFLSIPFSLLVAAPLTYGFHATLLYHRKAIDKTEALKYGLLSVFPSHWSTEP